MQKQQVVNLTCANRYPGIGMDGGGPPVGVQVGGHPGGLVVGHHPAAHPPLNLPGGHQPLGLAAPRPLSHHQVSLGNFQSFNSHQKVYHQLVS